MGFYILGELVTVMQIFGILLLFVGVGFLFVREEVHS